MHFYRSLWPVKAISFDLDDTLYNNVPVIERTEREVLAFMQRTFPELKGLDLDKFAQYRLALKEREPDIYHDVSEWRRRSFHLTLLDHGYSESAAQQGAAQTMRNFAYWRSQIDVPEETHQAMSELAKRYPLVAITNGNADPDICGLGHYFQFVLRAGPHGRAKPFGDMYRHAAQRLDLPLDSLLHVGDDLTTDVAGSIQAGAQSCWINDKGRSLLTIRDARLLPHIEINQLSELLSLS